VDHHIPIGLPSKAFHALTEHSGEPCYSDKCVDILCGLIHHWVATTPAAPNRWAASTADDGEDEYRAFTDADLYEPEPAAPRTSPATPALPAAALSAATATGATIPPAVATTKGYQWKQLFLPNGTELRSIYCGRSVYATVENEQIIHDGAPTTPSRLANAQGCGTRNAWKTLWLCFPGSTRWLRADRCRDQ
jgi:hypothetical protein